jgi:hypothetical protein
MDLHLWEIDTAWFLPQPHEHMSQNFGYRSWKEFVECKPYRIWKPYVLSSWAWKENKLQLVFISPERFIGMNRAEIFIQKEDEEEIRTWIKKHMPKFWKL